MTAARQSGLAIARLDRMSAVDGQWLSPPSGRSGLIRGMVVYVIVGVGLIFGYLVVLP